jgi:hypothetical protein
MKRILAVLLLLCVPCQVLAGVTIAKADRIHNSSPGFCLWCSIEMLGRAHKLKEVEGLTKFYADWRYEIYDEDTKTWEKKPWDKGHTLAEGASQLKLLGVKSHVYIGVTRKEVKKACDDGNGCVVSLKWWKPVRIGQVPAEHAVVVIDVTDTHVYFIDPNHAADVYRAEFDWFDYYFTHVMLTVGSE